MDLLCLFRLSRYFIDLEKDDEIHNTQLAMSSRSSFCRQIILDEHKLNIRKIILTWPIVIVEFVPFFDSFLFLSRRTKSFEHFDGIWTFPMPISYYYFFFFFESIVIKNSIFNMKMLFFKQSVHLNGFNTNTIWNLISKNVVHFNWIQVILLEKHWTLNNWNDVWKEIKRMMLKRHQL